MFSLRVLLTFSFFFFFQFQPGAAYKIVAYNKNVYIAWVFFAK